MLWESLIWQSLGASLVPGLGAQRGAADVGPGRPLWDVLGGVEQPPSPHLLDARSPSVMTTTDVPRHFPVPPGENPRPGYVSLQEPCWAPLSPALLAPPEPLSSQSLSPPGHQSPLGSQAPVTPPPPPGVPSPHPWPSHHASRGPPRPNSHQPPPACRRLGCVCLSFGMSWACGLVPLRRCPRGFSCHSVCPRGFSCLFCLT